MIDSRKAARGSAAGLAAVSAPAARPLQGCLLLLSAGPITQGPAASCASACACACMLCIQRSLPLTRMAFGMLSSSAKLSEYTVAVMALRAAQERGACGIFVAGPVQGDRHEGSSCFAAGLHC